MSKFQALTRQKKVKLGNNDQKCKSEDSDSDYKKEKDIITKSPLIPEKTTSKTVVLCNLYDIVYEVFHKYYYL